MTFTLVLDRVSIDSTSTSAVPLTREEHAAVISLLDKEIEALRTTVINASVRNKTLYINLHRNKTFFLYMDDRVGYLTKKPSHTKGCNSFDS